MLFTTAYNLYQYLLLSFSGSSTEQLKVAHGFPREQIDSQKLFLGSALSFKCQQHILLAMGRFLPVQTGLLQIQPSI